jgi:hypothetical protein
MQALLRGDFDAFESYLADEFTYVHTSGRVQSKQEYMRDLRGQKFESLQHEDVQVRMYGDVAVITGRSRSRRILPAHSERRPQRSPRSFS